MEIRQSRLAARMLLTTAVGALLLHPAAAIAQDTTSLDEIVVTAAPGTETEGSESWTTDWMRSATGLVLSQKETPQSTSVITDAQIKDRNLNTISKTLEAATGITVQAYETDRINYYSRGFQIDAYQYDGVPVAGDGAWTFGDNNPDMALYDHVEVVRGATGLMQGAGEPGASINFIRKRPLAYAQNQIAVSAATPAGGRVELDLSRPLNEAGTVRGRLIGVVDSRDGFIDGYKKKKQVLFGGLDIDLTDNTLLSFSLTHQRTQADGVTWGGLAPFYADGGLIDWDWGSSIGADWTYVDTERTEAVTSLEHVFANGWTGRLVYTYVKNDLDSTLAWISGVPDRVTGDGLSGYGQFYDGGYDQHNLNALLNGDFQAFGREHQFVLGAMASQGEGTYYGYRPNGGPTFPVNIGNMDGNYPVPPRAGSPTYTSTTETKQYGIYGTGQFNVSDSLSLLAGARINWWEGEQGSGGPPTASFKYSGEITPYVGFTYDLNAVYTAYGSISSIYKPELNRDAAGEYLDPTYGYNYELGVKGNPFDGALYLSAAVFQTEQKDVAQYISFDDVQNRSIYESIDGTTTRGFEVEAAGGITDRLAISGGYTFRISKDNEDRELRLDQPRHTLKIATDYRVARVLDDRLRLGGALRWQSGTDSIAFASDVETPSVHQGSYGVVDLSASYDVSDDSTLTLTVNNVLRKKYYATTGFYDTVVYGDDIGAELTLRAKF